MADSADCRAIDSLLVTVEFNPSIFAPNAFSPNDDGINDVFHIFAKGVTVVIEFKVFDRWGELVFEDGNFSAGDPLHGWDGSFRGRPMNTGVFVYYAKVGMLDGTERNGY